ncbi:MAG: hypothetical protein WDN27_01040 [Candidatus Saccharibacteria bacterium]
MALHDTQPDAPLSPIYLNLRTPHHPNPDKRGPLSDDTMNRIGEQFGHMAFRSRDCFVGLPDAGEPFADQLERTATRHGLPITRLYLHKIAGSREIADLVDGTYEHGESCLLVDDLITQADSKLRAIRVLQGNGLNVEEILVLVDRQQGGAAQLEKLGYQLRSVFKLDELLAFYVEEGLLPRRKAEEVLAYIRANQV